MKEYNSSIDAEKDKKNNGLVVLLLGLATVLIALIGATFAYFSAVISKPNGNQNVTLSTTTVKGVVYTAGEHLKIENAMPGDSDDVKFTIENPNAATDIYYSMRLVITDDTFTNADGDEQLIITLSGGGLTDAISIDLTNGENYYTAPIESEEGTEPTYKSIVLASNLKVEPGVIDEYTLKAQFVNFEDKAQDTNQGKNFSGYIDVYEVIATTVNTN